MSSVAVVGAGAWGTALALQAERAGHRVALVARDADVCFRHESQEGKPSASWVPAS